MKYYRNDAGDVFAYADDGSEDKYIAPNLRRMTPAEVSVHIGGNGPSRKQVALNKLNTDFDAAMAAIHSGWPGYEIQTWGIQSEEAQQWTAASAADKPLTPFLTQLWARRQALGWTEPFGDLVSRVIKNGNVYTQAVAACIAIRHCAERAIETATDPSTVTWKF